jgi:hydroxyacylglutathione hydrolase
MPATVRTAEFNLLLDGANPCRYFTIMMLEDHTGDIVRKARQGANVPAEAAAQAAGLSVVELTDLEQTGQCKRKPDFISLGKVLGLQGSHLADIANGWLPAAVDLSQWRELRQIDTTQGGNTVNCYLAWDEVTREAILIDTGWEAEAVRAIVQKEKLDLRHLFITHNHHDHVAAIDGLKTLYPKLRLHSSAKNISPEQRNRPNDCISVGSLRITHRETPGHSEDGVVYIIGGFPEDAPLVAVCGDTVFAGSMSRGFQSFDLLRQKIKEQILTLPPSTLLCPGHGPLTTIAEELGHNPFFSA